MEFVSSRDSRIRVNAVQAIVQGLSQDGGLFVPVSIPQISLKFVEELRALGYAERALRVLKPWLEEFSEEELKEVIDKAYTRFDVPEVAPLVPLQDNVQMLELWHGPTLAFKDVALQLMPHLLTACAKKVGEQREILILVATSGDTGKAALEGFADVPGTSICVFYPDQGVSEAQRLQMVTQRGNNTHVIAIRGNFDDAQTGVKKIFNDAEFAAQLDARGMVLSSANSINLGRLIPQIVYYFSAYADLLNRGVLELGEPMDVCVPTGNFGNILAANYAREMGLPIGKLICASNANNVLSDFINTGIYDRNRSFHLTTSPSMDILISSNLERMLYQLTGEAQVKGFMQSLRETGKYQLNEQATATMQSFLWGGWATESEVVAQIRRTFLDEGYLLDPHTAVAMHVLQAYRGKMGLYAPTIVDATASPYKFGRAVLGALTDDAPNETDFDCCNRLAELSNTEVPAAIAELPKLPIVHDALCDIGQMPETLMALITKR